ncbi:hypothetical protein evm_014696 [Chilo suppressalis]|nr:hypothetical protein evm_014696 [Chilo suppressalis]
MPQMKKDLSCKNSNTITPNFIVNKEIADEIGRNCTTLPLFEKGLFEYTYVRHYSLKTNELLKCHWAKYNREYGDRFKLMSKYLPLKPASRSHLTAGQLNTRYNHHHHQPINLPIAGAQAFPMDGIGRLGYDPPRGPSADWQVLKTADAAGNNGLTCLLKHGGAPDNMDLVTHPMNDHCKSRLTSMIVLFTCASELLI